MTQKLSPTASTRGGRAQATRLGRFVGLATLASLAALWPGTAAASSPLSSEAEVNSGQLNVTGSTARYTDILVFRSDTTLTVYDAVGALSAGPGCVQSGGQMASCDGSVSSVAMVGAGVKDTFRVGDIGVPAALLGGGGPDLLLGSNGTESIDGGADDDAILGAGGSDTLDGGSGADSLSGGPGVDEVTYASRSNGVLVTLDGASNDGEDANLNGFAEEKDYVQVDIERVRGGGGPDRLVGDGNANELSGGPDDDTLLGKHGNDTLIGGDESTLYPDVNDVIEGGYGDDVIDGGLGRDDLNGDANNDTIDAADNETDAGISCGTGTDSATADLGIDGFYGFPGCETVIWD